MCRVFGACKDPHAVKISPESSTTTHLTEQVQLWHVKPPKLEAQLLFLNLPPGSTVSILTCALALQAILLHAKCFTKQHSATFKETMKTQYNIVQFERTSLW